MQQTRSAWSPGTHSGLGYFLSPSMSCVWEGQGSGLQREVWGCQLSRLYQESHDCYCFSSSSSTHRLQSGDYPRISAFISTNTERLGLMAAEKNVLFAPLWLRDQRSGKEPNIDHLKKNHMMQFHDFLSQTQDFGAFGVGHVGCCTEGWFAS